MILTLALQLALQAAAPSLRHREQAPAPTAEETRSFDKLPDGSEGEYRWRESGEIIELFVDDHHLDGYLTRRSERKDARSAPLTFTFTQASTFRGDLSFSTRALHGESYTFLGHIVPNSRPAQHEGPWSLVGTLTLRSGKNTSTIPLQAPLTPEGPIADQ